MKRLTASEEKVMQILWELKRGFVREIRDKYPDPKPHYNTISTIIRILEKKGYIGHISYNKSHQYYPKISKDQYKSSSFDNLLKSYFNNSYQELVAFFSRKENLNQEELDGLIEIIRKNQKK